MKLNDIILNSEPFNHYTFKDVFSEHELIDILSIDLFNFSAELQGERASNKNRFFANDDNIKTNDVIKTIVEYFLSDDVINHFEKESGRNIRGNYLRVEFIEDKEKSWLKPHVDIHEKIVSMIIYLNNTNESENIGTSIYNSEKKLVKTIPYHHNTGFYFYPGHNTWHGLEPIKIKNSRKAIMINYCTFETEFKVI
jgi:hypothetical protein